MLKFSDKNDIVYLEKTKGHCFYMIIEGEYSLEKDLMIHKEEIYDPDEYNKLGKKRTIMKLSKGSICGLEVVFGSSTYEYTLRALSQSKQNIVFRIDLEELGDVKKEMKEELKRIYDIEKGIYVEHFEMHKKIKNKNTIVYRTLITREDKILHTNLQTIDLENKVAQKISEITKQKTETSRTPNLDIKNLKLSKNYLHGTRSVNRKELQTVVINKSDEKKSKNITPNENTSNLISKLKFQKPIGLSKMKSQSMITVEPINLGIIKHHHLNQNSALFLTNDILNKYSHNKSPKQSRNEQHSSIEEAKEKIQTLKNKTNYETLQKSKSQATIFSRHLRNCVSSWKNTNSSTNYDTGIFNLPLLSIRGNSKDC